MVLNPSTVTGLCGILWTTRDPSTLTRAFSQADAWLLCSAIKRPKNVIGNLGIQGHEVGLQLVQAHQLVLIQCLSELETRVGFWGLVEGKGKEARA